MSRNGSGTYSLPAGQPVADGTTISATVFNALTSDLATALTQSLSADGQTPITDSLKGVNGSNAAPLYSFTASIGTGLYSPATDQVAVAAGGVQVVKYLATGASTALPITSTLATGTAPFVVASTTPVANLVAGGNATLGANTFTGLQTTAASTTGSAGLNLPHGVAPTSPVNGDLWTTTSGLLARINGATVGPFSAGGGVPSVIRSPRTSNTILAAADQGTLVEATSGTYSQTFTAAATLASGWWCYVSNAGTGYVTLDPNAAETITVNGVAQTTWVLWPREMGIIVCNGSGFYYYCIQKGEITQTIGAGVASVDFSTGLAYRRHMFLTLEKVATGTASTTLDLYINGAGFDDTIGYTTVTSTLASAGVNVAAITGGKQLLQSATTTSRLYSEILITPGPGGTSASVFSTFYGPASVVSGANVNLRRDNISESSITSISVVISSGTMTNGTFILREL